QMPRGPTTLASAASRPRRPARVSARPVINAESYSRCMAPVPKGIGIHAGNVTPSSRRWIQNSPFPGSRRTSDHCSPKFNSFNSFNPFNSSIHPFIHSSIYPAMNTTEKPHTNITEAPTEDEPKVSTTHAPPSTAHHPLVAPKPGEGGSTINHPTIARLPKQTRDMINIMLQDGLPYHVL